MKRPLDTAQLQFQIAFDVNLDEPWQESRPDHLLKRCDVTRIWHIGEKDDAPQVQRLFFRPTHAMPDMEQRLERTSRESPAVFRNHLRARHKVYGLLRIADENVFKNPPLFLLDPSPLH